MSTPEWWPQNPYPEDIFPMTTEEYTKRIPDDGERTAVSGCLGRLFWEMASKRIWQAVQDNIPQREIDASRYQPEEPTDEPDNIR